MAKQTVMLSGAGLRTSATTDDLVLKPLIKAGLICYDRLAAVDVTSKATLITFGFIKGANEVLVESFAPAAAAAVVSTSSRVFAPADWKPFARFSGGSAGDVLKVFAYGYSTWPAET